MLHICIMLRSQIKLTSYDFSDLHITGEFDNRPGTGRFLRIFSCVVTYRTGPAGVCILKHRPMPGRAPCNVLRCPAGFVRDQPDTVRCPADFTRFFHVQWWKYLYQNSPLFLQINRLLQKKDWGWLWQWWWWKPHLLKTAKFSIALVGCRLIILSWSSNIYFVFMYWSLEMEYLCKCNMYFCKNTSLLTGGCSTHITSAGARTGIGRFDKRFFKVSCACQTSYDAQTGTVGIVRFKF